MRLQTLVISLGFFTLALQGQQTRPAITAPAAQAASPVAAAAPVVASADPNSLTVSPETYIIGTGDVLQLNVWKEPSLSSSGIAVRPDGRISLPLLGDLPASGMTPTVLGHDIAERLKKYITDPLVTVTVVGVAPKEIFLIGEIQKTGPIILTPGMNTLQAIAAAGGLSPFAKKKLYILRKDAKGEQKISFDYKKALKTGDAQGITLMPGDTIVVP